MFVNVNTPHTFKKKDIPKPITVQGFTQDDYKAFRSDLQKWVDLDFGFIPISIDSYGGRVDGLVSIIEIVEALKRKDDTIITSVNGYAMSAGVLFTGLVGTKGYRFGSPNARYMLHEFSSSKSGKVKELKSGIEETSRFNKDMFEMLGDRCKDDKQYFVEIMNNNNNADYWFKSEEAKNHNLIDKIGVPVIDVDFKPKIKIS